MIYVQSSAIRSIAQAEWDIITSEDSGSNHPCFTGARERQTMCSYVSDLIETNEKHDRMTVMTTTRALGRVVIAGGTGVLGSLLATRLVAEGYDVTVLSRSARASRVDGVRCVAWSGGCSWLRSGTKHDADDAWVRELDGARAVVNVCGRTVDCIKSPDHCDEILRSRVESTLAIGRAMTRVAHPPRTWVQMATAHIYGDPPDVVCDESSQTGYGLAPTVGKAWEEAFNSALPTSVRGVILRTSFVLSRRGGALPKLEMLARLGLGGATGDGTQGMSWIHEEDMNRLFLRGIAHPRMEGVYVASAPVPVSNRAFMRELRSAVRMPIGIPAPAWVVRLGARLVLRTDPDLALYGRYVVPTRLLAEGYEFSYREIGPALRSIYGRSGAGKSKGGSNEAFQNATQGSEKPIPAWQE
jgi:uncharacterized protein (TIGR01777 family)